MKQIVYVLIIVILTNVFVFAEDTHVSELSSEEQFKLGNELTAIENLESLDIVRNAESRWNQTSLITRRDALKISYVFNTYDRDFIGITSGYTAEQIKDEPEKEAWLYGMNSYYGNYRTARKFEFSDIEPLSYDYKLAASLFYYNLITGQEQDGKLYANFDNNMTYNEAFVTVCRMLSTSSGSRFYADLYIAKYYYENNQEVCNPYYQFCIDTGMINCKNALSEYEMNIYPEQLEENITAYEYLYLVNQALYIHTRQVGDYAQLYNYRRINTRIKLEEDYLTKQHDIMD